MSDAPFGFEEKQETEGNVEKVTIGDATLYRGNCLEVMALIEAVDQCITDPPYEARMHTENRMTKVAGEYGTAIEAHRFAAMDEFTRTEITKAIIAKCSGWVLFFCQTEGVYYWQNAIDNNGGRYRFTGVWVKPSSKPNFSGDCPGLGHETIVGGWCGQGKSKWNGGGQAGVWTANPEKRKDGNTHTSIKPQKLMRDLVGQFTSRGEVVLDPFMGSGSTGVAALAEGRKFIGIERDPEYFDICCKRVEEAQSGGFGEQYVKTKSRVTVALFEEPKPEKAPKPVAAPKPRGAPVKQDNLFLASEKRKIEAEGKTHRAAPAPKKRFGVPTISVAAEERKDEKPRPPIELLTPEYRRIVREAAGRIIPFDGDTFDDGIDPSGPKSVVGLDVEVYRNFFLANFERFDTGKRLSIEMSYRVQLDKARLSQLIHTERLCTFHGTTYDLPIIMLALKGASLAEIKEASNRIIQGGLKYWDVERELGVSVPRVDHIDLIEPNPAVRKGLKTLAGRLHARLMMDLPYPPESYLSAEQMNVTTLYCFNDIGHTKLLFNTMKEPLELRRALSNQYGGDFRSKSDAQVGEGIVKLRAEKLLNRKLRRNESIPQYALYSPPPFIKFTSATMTDFVAKIAASEFSIDTYGKVVMPTWMNGVELKFGETAYSFGIGGLHSTEGTRALHTDDEHFLLDIDVSSQYPMILLLLGLYPKAIGPIFLTVYKTIIDERLAAKKRLGEIKDLLDGNAKKGIERVTDDAQRTELIEERKQVQVRSEGGKIQVNGVYGKLGSPYSVLYAPDMMIATTLTGQLSLLMLIEAAEGVGISVVSANTDGIVFRCRRDRAAELDEIINNWQSGIGFEVDRTFYRSIYNSSVNSYIAVKEDGKMKLKGPHGDPWSEGSLREMMMKNPQMTVLTKAVTEYIKKQTPLIDTVRACKDVKMFVTVVNVKGGAKWREGSLAKVVRYYWSTEGEPILYSTASGKGTFKKVGNTDGAHPLMEMTGELPEDIDYERYAKEAEELARDLGVIEQKGKLI